MHLFRSALPVGVLCILPAAAHAGAWTQDAGSGQAIITGSYYATDHYWDNAGNRQSQPTYSKYELNPYLEYGLYDGVTVGGSLFLDRAHQDSGAGSAEQSHWGIGDSEFFLRKRLWQQDGLVVSAEPMIKLPSPESSGALPRLGSSHPDAGLGMSAGYGFSAWGQNHFADLDTQYRYRFGNEKDQINISGTVGFGITPRWMVMPQAFLTYRTATPAPAAFTESPADDYNLFKLQLSAVYKATEDISLQFGGFSNIDGKNTGDGDGVLMAVWKKF